MLVYFDCLGDLIETVYTYMFLAAQRLILCAIISKTQIKIYCFVIFSTSLYNYVFYKIISPLNMLKLKLLMHMMIIKILFLL